MSSNSFEDWLFRNSIRIPDSLKQKMRAKFVYCVDTLFQLKQMNGLKEIIADLKLNTIETAKFHVIISKLNNNSSGGPGPGAQVMTITPELISISDNQNGSVNIKWKLVQKPLNITCQNQLKVEYGQDEKELDFDHTNDHIINMNNKIDLYSIKETKNVVIKDINAYIFRLKWRNFSNTKALKIKSDLWDINNKGPLIQVNNNIITHTGTTSWNSIYGKVICKAPYTYHWQFKINSFAIHFMFGVAKISNQYACKGTYLGTKEAGYYVKGTNTANSYPGGTDGPYGMERFNKNGCLLDMYLDLKNYTLSFKTGGIDTGIVKSNLAQENYTMIVSLYNKQKIELVAFDYK